MFFFCFLWYLWCLLVTSSCRFLLLPCVFLPNKAGTFFFSSVGFPGFEKTSIAWESHESHFQKPLMLSTSYVTALALENLLLNSVSNIHSRCDCTSTIYNIYFLLALLSLASFALFFGLYFVE